MLSTEVLIHFPESQISDTLLRLVQLKEQDMYYVLNEEAEKVSRAIG